jgi:tRNA-2-methylthio-N6-dimethylallyladenosine synthase
MKYHIITYGCQMNVSDSKRIVVMLQQQGHKPIKADSSSEALTKADLIVINACSVRQSAINRVFSEIHKLYSTEGKKRKKIILAGCLLESDKKKIQEKVDEFWKPDKYFHCQPINAPGSDHVFIPIMTGCNNFCSYCVVPYTRGRERSKPADEIIKEIKSLIKNGCKEITLLGQNVNSYRSQIASTKIQTNSHPASNHPKGGKYQISKNKNSQLLVTNSQSLEHGEITFPQLLRIINAIPGDFTIKFLTSHPKDMSDELIEVIAECKKVAKEIHLPVQSGDNTILKKMNRKYTVGHYKKLIKKIRAKIPNTIISTDVIVGFPGETKKQFANTVKLFQQIKFDKAYINKYSPRFGTIAYKLKDDVPQEEKKRRWKILEDLANKKAAKN